MQLDKSIYENARQSKDKRFDGKFFTGVHSTGIFCRPICPAPSPKPENVIYYDTAAAALEAGLRPCYRCRPELAPDSPVWKGVSASLERALSYIKNGYLNTHSVGELAETLGLGDRHLRRLFKTHLGCSPKTLANTERLFFGKRLLQDSNLKISQIAYAAGFNSLRRFNDAFKEAYHKTPTEVRKTVETKPESDIKIFLAYRKPYDFNQILSFFRARIVDEIESIENEVYTRTFKLDDMVGYFSVKNESKKSGLVVSVYANNFNQLFELTKRIRRMFDLDTDIELIKQCFMNDEVLADLVKKYNIQRLPGSWDIFEFSIRAILGQVVSVKAATTFTKRFVQKFAKKVPNSKLMRFPSPEEVRGESFLDIGLSRAKNDSIIAIVSSFNDRSLNKLYYKNLDELIYYLTNIKGIGTWTANYIAMRGLSEPDALPSNDLGLINAIEKNYKKISEKEIIKLASNWQPWRSYAVILLWKSLEGDN